MNNHVLIADDEDDVLKLVGTNLQSAGFSVIEAANGMEALGKARERLPALVVLDSMLPDLPGLEVCKLLKGDARTAGIPIIMLTAKAQESDRVAGLEAGADDYVTKPFSLRELALRVRAQIRRGQPAAAPDAVMEGGDITLDPNTHDVRVKGKPKPIHLSPTEFRLLALLMARPSRVHSRDSLLREVWGYTVPIVSRTVDIRILRLREKLGKAGDAVETVRGFGYRFSPASA
jgi:two-component system, OmpR family, phosphate regulon response regulator PhoB